MLEAYLELSCTSTMEIFGENSKWRKVLKYFCKKVYRRAYKGSMLDCALNAPLNCTSNLK